MALAWRQVEDLIKPNEVADSHLSPGQGSSHSTLECYWDQSETITRILGCYSNFHTENSIKTHPQLFPRLIILP